MENLQEIALFLDSPLYLIREEKQALSELVDAQAQIVFFFGKADQHTRNKHGEIVLEKMIAALAAKQVQNPKITDIPITLIELQENTKITWDFEKLSVEKIIFFGAAIAAKVGITHKEYEIFEMGQVKCLIADTLAAVEAEQSRKLQLWNSLLAMFVGVY